MQLPIYRFFLGANLSYWYTESIEARRLLARVVKEGVQLRGGGGGGGEGGGGGGGGVRENVSPENLRSLRYFMSVSVPSSFEIFQNTWHLCYASLFN
jgi:hypothetical protein